VQDADLRYSPLPYEVEGFDRAMASGVIRLIPTDPPAVTVLPTSARALRDAGVAFVLASGVVVVVMLVAGSGGYLGGLGVAALLGSAALGFWAVATALKRWGRTLLAELALGYTTTPPGVSASWWLGRSAYGRNGPQWEWRGLWLLRPDGTVRSAPSRQGVPPGVYPSPSRPGAMELWTGRQWTGYFPPT
jgi:hypothetical protein